MNTQYALHAVFGAPIVKLSEVSEEYFGMKYVTAKAKANANEFPIPTFRLNSDSKSENEPKSSVGRKMPLFISVDDLATYIDKKRETAKAEWESIYGPFH